MTYEFTDPYAEACVVEPVGLSQHIEGVGSAYSEYYGLGENPIGFAPLQNRWGECNWTARDLI
jgi:hypothetical protein